MDYRLVCTDKQYSEFVANKAKRYRKIGIFAICIVVISGVLRKFGFYLEETTNQAVPNILTGLVFIALLSWLISSINIYTERNRARESYIISDGYTITYHMLKSRDVVGRLRQAYHTYYITGISNIVEKASYYQVYGTIELTETVNSHQGSKKMSKVNIPKYFSGLDELISELNTRVNKWEGVSNGK